MKKKIITLCGLVLFCCGCTSVQQESYANIITSTTNSKIKITNTYRSGYNYYLPKGMHLLSYHNGNEIISKNHKIYYMYVDYISYFNEKKETYIEKADVVYSQRIENNNYFGYLEIKNTSNDKYFIEIMYNYAKIEVIVEKNETSEAIAYAMSILSSIEYQDTVLKSLMGEDILRSNEVEYNIFETAKTESGYLQISEEYGQYDKEDDTVDPDFIRR